MAHILSIWGWRNSCTKITLWSSVAVSILHGCVHWEQWTEEQHSLLRRRISWLRHITLRVLDVCVCVCVCVCVWDSSVAMLRFATTVNNKSQITNQNILRIRRIIFIFLQKYLSHDRFGYCVMTQLSSQFQSFVISVCWPSSRYDYLRQVSVNHRRQYGYISPLWRWTWVPFSRRVTAVHVKARTNNSAPTLSGIGV